MMNITKNFEVEVTKTTDIEADEQKALLGIFSFAVDKMKESHARTATFNTADFSFARVFDDDFDFTIELNVSEGFNRWIGKFECGESFLEVIGVFNPDTN